MDQRGGVRAWLDGPKYGPRAKPLVTLADTHRRAWTLSADGSRAKCGECDASLTVLPLMTLSMLVRALDGHVC